MSRRLIGPVGRRGDEMAGRVRELAALDVDPDVAAGATSPEARGWTALAAYTPPLLGTALFLTVLLTTGWAARIAFPFSDPHNWIAALFAAERDGDWLGYVWRPFNAQRIPVALLAQALDVEVLRGQVPSFLIGAAVLWLAGCASVLLLLRSGPPWRVRTWVGLALAALLLNARLAEDLALPVFSVYLFVAGPALAACVWLQFAPMQGFRSPALWTAIVLAALASCGNAAGLAIWPALLAVSFLQDRSRGQLLIIGGAALAVCISVEGGLGAPVGAGTIPAESALGHLGRMICYFCTFGGLPWSHLGGVGGAGAVVGGLIWLAVAWTLARAQLKARDALAPIVAAGVACMIFGLLTAALATLGRVDEATKPFAATRYAPFALVLQGGVLLGGIRSLAAQGLRALAIGAVAVAILSLALSLHDAREIRHVSHRIRRDSVAFDQRSPPVANAFAMSPTPDFAHDIRIELARRGLPH